jgi:Zn-dependent protease
MVFYKSEVAQMLISVITISLAFSIGFRASFPMILLTIGMGFVLHEIGHKLVAIRFGCKAFYRMWVPGLILVFMFIPFGIFFAAPGAVYIFKHGLTRRENGLISLAGPVVNVILALIFFYLMFLPSLQELGMWGFKINLFLAMFNLLPVPPLDGSKVIGWSPFAWFVVIGTAAVLFFSPQILLGLF